MATFSQLISFAHSRLQSFQHRFYWYSQWWTGAAVLHYLVKTEWSCHSLIYGNEDLNSKASGPRSGSSVLNLSNTYPSAANRSSVPWIALNWLCIKIPVFLKQSIMVVSSSVNHGYLSIIMPPSMLMFGNSLLVLIALIFLQIALAQYLALNNRITPWSISYRMRLCLEVKR